MKKINYTVHVGNIGTVYSGADHAAADRSFTEYKDQSKQYGRAAGESVYMFENGEIAREFTGEIDSRETEAISANEDDAQETQKQSEAQDRAASEANERFYGGTD